MESCRKAVKDRILVDMLGSVVDSTGGGWKVLILDEFTTRVLSSTLRMSDITDCNVSVVEDLAKAREPLQQPAVYFIQPSAASIARLLEDFGGPDGTTRVGKAGSKQLYPSLHIFLSNKIPAEGLEKLKANPRLVKCLKTLKELNLEFLTVDSRTMITDHPEAARMLLSDSAEGNRALLSKQLDSIAMRLATLFATLKEVPVVRYKAPRAPQPGDPPNSLRAALPQLLAARVSDRLAGMQRSGQLPAKESCDLLVLDRSYDAVAPFIHEWSYEALVYDLVALEGNVFRYEAEPQSGGRPEVREAQLEERDELWLELRHTFIAEVYSGLADKFKQLQAKNKAAKAAGGGGLSKGGEAMSAAAIRALLMALPEYRELGARLSLHIALSSELKTATNARQLTDVGELEQDLVLGEKNSKEMLAFLTERQAQMDPVDKVRLLACYLATHPGKLDVNKRMQWQKTAGLTGEDMGALCGGLSRLGVRVMEQAASAEGGRSGGFFGGGGKKKGSSKATRKKRGGDEEDQYALNRFEPLLADILGDLVGGRLGAEEYPYLKPPSSDSESDSQRASAASARTGRSALNWARKGGSEGAANSQSGGGRRLVVFILGGATRGEMRVVHQLAASSGRDVILGSTNVGTPASFVDLLYSLAPRGGVV